MAGFLDAILGMSGQERTEALRQLGRDAEYYVPPELRSRLGLLAQALEFTDAGDMPAAADASRELWNNPSVGSAANYAAAGLGLALPYVSSRMMQEGVDVAGDAISSLSDDAKSIWERINQPGPVPTMYSGPAGFDDYLKRVNPRGVRVAAEDRPNLMMGDMYGMLPSGAKRVGKKDDVSFYRGPDGDFYATAFNPDVGEQDVVGYIMPRGDMTELAVVSEMQGKGLGGELQYLFRKENPNAPTGGLTEAGEKALRKTYERLSSEGLLGDFLPTPRNDAEAIAKQVLEMRAAGRAGDVTEEMMAAADPQYMFYNTPLPMDEASRMARAREVGRVDDQYHATLADFQAFRPSETGLVGRGVYSGDFPTDIEDYARKQGTSEGLNIIPLLAPSEQTYARRIDWQNLVDADEAFPWNATVDETIQGFKRAADTMSSQGYSGVNSQPGERATFDPESLRSRFARFDPEFRHLGNLSAGVGGLGILSVMQDEQDRENEIRQYLGGLL